MELYKDLKLKNFSFYNLKFKRRSKMKYILSCVVLISLSTCSPSPTSWAKTFGGTDEEHAVSISKTSDGGYIVAGWTASFGTLFSGYDLLVIKLNSSGNIQWAKTFDVRGNDGACSICETSDGGYIVAGWTASLGAVFLGVEIEDFLVIKLNSSGNIEWAKTFGGTNYDWANSICKTSDGGYIVAGWTGSFGAGGSDFLVIKLNSSGNIEWAKTFGGTNEDRASSISKTSDGGYIVAGWTYSFGAGEYDFLVLKIKPDGSMTPDCRWYPANPTVTSPTLSTTSPNLAITSPSISFLRISPTITFPNLLTDTICK